MNNRQELERKTPHQPENEIPPKGPSLVLLYTLVVVALVAATVLAGLIVLPFYQHRH